MKSQDLQKKKLPDTPGVYFFIKGAGSRRKIFYIGKATSLNDRVRSYFSSDVLAARGPGIIRMVDEARTVEWEVTASVLEALILEAALIKKHHPPYNSLGKDDKSFNYVVITREDFPRVLLIRGKELFQNSRTSDVLHADVGHPMSGRTNQLPATSYQLLAIYGPFPHGGELKVALKLVRKIFPYRDRCIPYEKKAPSFTQGSPTSLSKACFNAQIGLCPGVCSGAISKQEYARTIRHIRLFFEGRKRRLVRVMEREMNIAAKQEEFEKAAALRKTLFALGHINDIALIKARRMEVEQHIDTFAHSSISPAIASRPFRIEAYDIAHLGGGETVGVMTVVIDGEIEKNAYRKFRIRAATRGSDTGALKEVLERRLGHSEWPLPQLIVVDGGKAQVGVAERALRAHFGEIDIPAIPIVGVVKDEHHRPRNIIGNRGLVRLHEKAILLANSEAHRFAISYHRLRRAKRLRER